MDCHVATNADHVSIEDYHVATNADHVSIEDCHVAINADHVAIDACHVVINADHVSIEDYHVAINADHVSIEDCHVAINADHVAIDACHVVINAGQTHHAFSAQASRSGTNSIRVNLLDTQQRANHEQRKLLESTVWQSTLDAQCLNEALRKVPHARPTARIHDAIVVLLGCTGG